MAGGGRNAPIVLFYYMFYLGLANGQRRRITRFVRFVRRSAATMADKTLATSVCVLCVCHFIALAHNGVENPSAMCRTLTIVCA